MAAIAFRMLFILPMRLRLHDAYQGEAAASVPQRCTRTFFRVDEQAMRGEACQHVVVRKLREFFFKLHVCGFGEL